MPQKKPSAALIGNDDAPTAFNVLAQKLRILRRQANLTLQQLSQCSGISASALSKIENGQLSPTYEKIAALAQGLQVDVGELFTPAQPPLQRTRRSVWRQGQGNTHATPQYAYAMLHADLSDKRFIPLLTTVKAHERTQFPKLLVHDGEEMIYVLSGAVMLFTDSYEPLQLNAGDSCYFDSTMGHACISLGEADAQVLWLCSHIGV
jgi:transcriptional regulator with XRE-family HTH domain